jgi:hypothetical protein
MVSIYKEEDCVHYVPYSALTKFISLSANINDNEAYRIKEEIDVLDYDNGKVLYDRKDVFRENDPFYSKDKYNWIRWFFEAHPFMNRIMFVFDD